MTATAMKNMAEPMTLICGGTATRAAPHTKSGKVWSAPATRYVMTKSSTESAKARKNPARIPGQMRGRVTLERRQRTGVEISRRLLEMLILARQTGAHGHDHEADVEHDVRDQDRDEAEPEAENPERPLVEEEREEGGAHHDLRRRHRQEDEEVRRALPEKPVADERHRHERPDHRRKGAREERDLDREPDGTAEPRVVEWVEPVVEREALPGEVEATDRVVEREHDDDHDRDEQVGEGEHCEEGERVPSHERPRTAEYAGPVPRGGDCLDRGRHAVPVVTRSVPTLRA